jgi:hypothetical protein
MKQNPGASLARRPGFRVSPTEEFWWNTVHQRNFSPIRAIRGPASFWIKSFDRREKHSVSRHPPRLLRYGLETVDNLHHCAIFYQQGRTCTRRYLRLPSTLITRAPARLFCTSVASACVISRARAGGRNRGLGNRVSAPHCTDLPQRLAEQPGHRVHRQGDSPVTACPGGEAPLSNPARTADERCPARLVSGFSDACGDGFVEASQQRRSAFGATGP